MGAPRPRTAAFETNHPAVAAAYVLVTLVLTMFAVQPVLIALSVAGALAYGCLSRGVRSCARALRWQLPTILLIALVNPLFSASGSTVLFCIGPRVVYAESMAYGCAMGALFVASVLWFEAAASMLPQSKVMALAGNAAPTIALMVSMCMRLIPKFVRRGRQIAQVQDVAARAAAECGAGLGAESEFGALAGESAEELHVAVPGPRSNGAGVGETIVGASGDSCVAAVPSALDAGETRAAEAVASAAEQPHRLAKRLAAPAVRARLRQTHVLMGWSLEDSLETADAMRARGWSAQMRRSTYTRYRFAAADAFALVTLLLAGALCLLLAWAATSQFAFYPTMSRLIAWWGYVPYACWMFLPALALARNERMFS